MTWPGKIHNGARAGNFRKHAFRLFAPYKPREHASTSAQIVAKLQLLFSPFSPFSPFSAFAGAGVLRQLAARPA
jgi:hypothetical protein